jgi:lipoate-protein ligase A
MSVDEALLCSVEGTPVLRLYSWRQPALSLGYRQEPPAELERAVERGFEVVRRVTGGGSVLHAGDLTYAVVAPRDSDALPRNVRASYAWIRDAVIDGLRDLGVAAEPAAAADGADRAELCFVGATGQEIALDGRKLVGSAQRRVSWGLLQHGSVRMADDRALYRSLLGQSPGPPAALEASREELEDALIRAFERASGRPLEPGTLDDSEDALARARVAVRVRAPLDTPSLFSRRAMACADRLP